MKRIFLEKFVLLTIFFVFYILIEMIMFYWLSFGLFPKIMIVDVVVTLVLASIAFLFKSHKTSIIYLSFWLFLAALVALVNFTMNYELNGEIFSIMHLLYAGEALNVFVADFIHWDAIVTMIAIFVFYLMTIKYVRKLFFKPFPKSKLYTLKTIPFYLIVLFLVLPIINFTSPDYNTYSDLYNVSLFKRNTLNKYGLMGFYIKEIDSLVFTDSNGLSIDELKDQLILENPNDYDESNLAVEYKGLLEGKNVISIMLESGQSFAVNPVLTPNLYKMTTEGLFFPNHHSENKTNVSETIGILGHFPSKGIMSSRFDYDFSYSLPNILKDYGYHTAYFHENIGRFYDRENLIPELGFQDYYFHEDLFPDETIYGWGGDYTLDSRTMTRMLDFMFQEEDDEPFFYYWTSLVSHGPYDRNYPSERGINNKQKFTNLGYFDQIDTAEENGDWVNIMDDSSNPLDPGRIRFYQAAIMDFDVALGILLDALEDEGILDDTVILIYGDHNLFYHQMHLRLNDAESGEVHYPYMYETFFTIYNPTLTNAYLLNNPESDTTLDKFVTPYDILPTYYHLLGIPYYKNYTLGESVLREMDTIFYSHKITAFFDKEYFTYSDISIYYPENIDLITDFEAQNFLLNVDQLTERILWLEMWMDATITRK